MSERPEPPSSYILRDLHDVAVPPSVSWLPQTIGWKILAAIVLLVLLYIVCQFVLQWWRNRYRREALAAISALKPGDSDTPKSLFFIIKAVLIYIDSRNAKLFGDAFLRKLNELNPKRQDFSDETAKLWLKKMVNPRVELTQDQRIALIDKANAWIKEHSQMSAVSQSPSRSEEILGERDD